jgi:hypothetical protein
MTNADKDSDDDDDTIGDSEPDTMPDDDKKATQKKKKGGKVHGVKPKERLDKRARGGSSGIHIKPSHKGLLHKDLGVKQGDPIPEEKLEKAKNSSDPAVRKRATFAENAKHWSH